MGLSALAVLNGAFDLCNIKSQGEELSAADTQDGFRRLNNMVKAWATSWLTAPFVARKVFPTVANQNTYTIGPGGQFDTERPLALTGAGLLLNATTNTYNITAVSQANQTFTVAGNQTNYFTPGTTFQVNGSTGNDDAYTVVSSVFGVSTVITVLELIPSATANGSISVSVTTTSTIEIPRGILTDDAYEAVRIKTLSSVLFTSVYYNTTSPYGTIYLWPTPDNSNSPVVLYMRQQIAEFANLTTEYNFPPGYEEALEYNLAQRLLTPYGVKEPTVLQSVNAEAIRTLGAIKRANVKLTDLPVDPAFTHDRRGGYNILTGTGG